MSKKYTDNDLPKIAIGGGVLVLAAGMAGFAAKRFKICAPHQYMVRTGFGIKDMVVSKTGIVWPLQRYQNVSLNPFNCSFRLHNMSKEKVEFELPMVFTLGPYDPKLNPSKFENYARKALNMQQEEIISTVKGIIHGECRILTAGMTIEELFSDRDKFRQTMTGKVQEDLDKFGLHIYNSNVEEMMDMKGNEYFQFRRKRALETAINEAKIDVAQARTLGSVGEKERETFTRKRVSEFDADAIKTENEQHICIEESKMLLQVKQAEFLKISAIATINSDMDAKLVGMEKSRQLEMKRHQERVESLRAQHLSEAQIDAEKEVILAQGKGQAIRAMADANLYAKQLEAQGTQVVFEKQAEGFRQVLAAVGDQNALLSHYWNLERGLYEKLASYNANAVQGLKPKINIWSTSPNENSISSLQNIAFAMPPVIEMLKQRTDIDLNSLFPKTPKV